MPDPPLAATTGCSAEERIIALEALPRSGDSPDPGMAEFTVADNGIGIAPEYCERVFLIFKRLHERGRYPGTGIGLAIAKRVVERHGGAIWIDSLPGRGSTSHFTLPLASAPERPEWIA